MQTYEDWKKFQNKKQKTLDKNYDKQAMETLKEIQKLYQETSDKVELEILRWYRDMDAIKQANPNFKFSELQHLEDFYKQLDLILDELAKAEIEIVEHGMKKLFVTDYIDFDAINKKYLDMELHTPLPEFNQMPQVQVLESYMSMPEVSQKVFENAQKGFNEFIAKRFANSELDIVDKMIQEIDLAWYYDGTAGRWFNVRIEERLMKLGYTVKDEVRKGIITGEGLGKLQAKLKKDLDITYKQANTLVRTELATIENEAVIHNAKKLGYNALEFATMKDEKVCKLCKAKEGEVVPLEARGGDFVVHPNCRCVLVEAIIDENGKPIHSSFETSGEADAYFDAKQIEWERQNAKWIEQQQAKKKLAEQREEEERKKPKLKDKSQTKKRTKKKTKNGTEIKIDI